MFVRILMSFMVVFFIGCSGLGKDADSDPAQDSSRGNPKALDSELGGISRAGLKSSKPKGELYQVKPIKSLEVPPDLLNQSNDAVVENASGSSEPALRVLPEIVGAKIVRDDDQYSLEVDTDVETAWQVMTEYWSLGSIDLVGFNPEAGTMETDWIEEARLADDSTSAIKLAKQLLTSLNKTDTALDKFRLRFERLEGDRAAIHVSHRWTVRKELTYSKRVSEFAWVELEGDQERLADFMNNIILLFDGTATQG